MLCLPIVSWLFPSTKLFINCSSESIELSLFLENPDSFSVALIDVMVPIYHAFLDDNGYSISVNGARYLSRLQNTV